MLIGLSFTVPTFYEVPKPLTDAQQQALDRTTQRLEGKQVENSTLQARISETVNKLKTATDLDTAQRHLSSLKKEVRKQQSTQNAITEATEASQSFQGMAADQFAAELKALTEQDEIPPELQAELMNIFERLAERLPKGPLSDSLNQVQGKAVTPETLRDIIAALEEMEKSVDLAQLEAQLAASQKDLALATIAPETSGDGVANSDGAPGQDAGTSEVQGTRENTSNSEAQTTDMGEMGNETDTENSTTPLTGEEASISQIDGEQLTLTAETSGTAESFSGVFTGETRDNAPVYLPFSDVLLNAERAYAEAVEITVFLSDIRHRLKPIWRQFPETMKNNIIKIVVAVSIVAIVYLVLRHYGITDDIRLENVPKIKAWVASFGRIAPLVYIGLYLVSTVFFLPGTPVTVLAGFVFGPLWGVFYASIASIISVSVAFLIARYVARGLVESWVKDNAQFER